MSKKVKFLSGVIVFACVLPTITAASDAPVADFFAVPTSGWDLYYRPEFVSLSTGEITSFLWEFGDDSTSTELAPNHKYLQPGVYTITLIVSGPDGSDTLRKVDYITVRDFDTEYNYPDYVLAEPTQAAFDSALDSIETNGGGRILFGFTDDTLNLNWDSSVSPRRDFYGNNLIIDGEDRNITFYYNGSAACSQEEGGPSLRIHGDDNIVRNFTWDRFPDGLHTRGGHRNLIENVMVNIICEDAMTLNGGGNYCLDCIIRDCSYGASDDKTIMINSWGTDNPAGKAVITGCYSYDGNQPIRMTGTGILVVRNCEFAGPRNNGPRFGGNTNFVIFENNYSHDTKSGLRLSDWVSIIVRNNTIENCSQYGIRTQYTDGILARIENNIITGNKAGIYLLDNKVMMDLGGGLLDVHRHNLLSGPGTVAAPSVGGNTLNGNIPYDLTNLSGDTVKAEYNFWDHSTVAEVLSNDVSGPADVDPLGGGVQAGIRLSPEVPTGYLLSQNYPNPFNPETKILYSITNSEFVTITIYDLQGQEVKSLVDEFHPPGIYSIILDASLLPSGVYFYKMQAGNFVEMKKMIVLK
ncbi:MAG: right-handed parallel beta-helix repeat-containing protein [Fidelibacterota bacterium]|nr:MAG: right-handed parallel beta-helix repeat-containing protein [Candidatus Neomarinimicrobiota bacterium]